jgi:uncharacterized membrane protein YfcA
MPALFDALPSLAQLALTYPAFIAGYIVLGLVSFGTTLIVAPVLVNIMPLSRIVPLLALLDCVATTANGFRLGSKVAVRELVFMVPVMVLGSLLGAYLLLNLPARPLMAALGVFLVGNALYTFFGKPADRVIAQAWVVPLGFFGGVCSALFGSGGPLYATYFSRRLREPDALRATQSVLLSMATFTRAVIFALAGVYADYKLVLLAISLLPAMALGMRIGERITLRLTRKQFLRVLHSVLLLAGITLCLRAVAGG